MSGLIFIISVFFSSFLNSKLLKNKHILGTTTSFGEILSDSCITEDSTNILVIKNSYIDLNYTPVDLVTLNDSNVKLRKDAAVDLKQMINDLNNTTTNKVKVVSGFRSSATQSSLKQRFKTILGINSNSRVADPGTSEHELGTAVDLSFVNGKSLWQNSATKELIWLDQHSHEYGFVLSYRPDNQAKTGFQFEPWHWRWVGKDLATQIRLSGKPPEDFYLPKSCP